MSCSTPGSQYCARKQPQPFLNCSPSVASGWLFTPKPISLPSKSWQSSCAYSRRMSMSPPAIAFWDFCCQWPPSLALPKLAVKVKRQQAVLEPHPRRCLQNERIERAGHSKVCTLLLFLIARYLLGGCNPDNQAKCTA